MNEQNFPEGKFRISWKHLILILIVVVGMLIGGHYYYVYQKNFILQVHTEFLSAVSSFKVHEIKNWI